jgi:rRNA maturation RNase YbeY
MPSATPLVVVLNRQRDQRVSLRSIRRWTLEALKLLHTDAELGIHLVTATEMARVNWDFLRHTGSTDVITFDHGSVPGRLHGELFISVADAMAQARSFHTTWQQELGRYIVHGLLHLAGEDDLEPAARRRMKRRENSLVRRLESVMPTDSLGLPFQPAPRSSPPHG